ncbi:MAG: substrate-binding domain-containing protein [Planctomycetaceae bacterium]|nr:substrate-binding domain-containing protein [Planctomycetaceae bacterium]
MGATTRRIAALALLMTVGTIAVAAEGRTFNPDREYDRLAWSDVEDRFGPVPAAGQDVTVGAVLKTLTNPYWQAVRAGYEEAAAAHGVTVEARAADNEADADRQAVVGDSILANSDILLVSPLTDQNLAPLARKARRGGVTVLNVDDAVLPDADHYIGKVQYDSGALAAAWFMENFPEGGKVAIIEGARSAYAVRRRTGGFSETLSRAGRRFSVVRVESGNWERGLARSLAADILQAHPDLLGFYCHNDTMALGVVDAVKTAGRHGKTMVVGTDGTAEAYDAIARGDLAATVDGLPRLLGVLAVETSLRLLAGQNLPRVVITPQVLVTQETAGQYREADTATLRRLLMP